MNYLNSLAGYKSLPAFWTHDPLKVDAANLVRRNRAPTLRTSCVQHFPDFLEIDLLLLRHVREISTAREIKAK